MNKDVYTSFDKVGLLEKCESMQQHCHTMALKYNSNIATAPFTTCPKQTRSDEIPAISNLSVYFYTDCDKGAERDDQ